MFLFYIFLTSLFSQVYFPTTNDNWQTISPEELNWCVDEINELDIFLDTTDTKVLIILKDGKIAYEKYFNDFGRDSVWYWASAGKSLLSTLIGIGIQENKIDLYEKTSTYLGEGWTSLPNEKEDLIKIYHNLAMTTGLDESRNISESNSPDSLHYLVDAGVRWYYYNTPYILLHDVLENVYQQNINIITNQKIKNKINMQGLWLDNIFYSKALDAARFGLLIMNKGVWIGDTILNYNNEYPNLMSESSSDDNPAYGLLWWLNGKMKYKQPGLNFTFDGKIVPNASDDMFMAAGKNDQRIYIDRPNGLVIIRLGNPGDEVALAVSGYDNDLWEKINNVMCKITDVENQPTFYHNEINLENLLVGKKINIYSINGKKIAKDVSYNHIKSELKGVVLIEYFEKEKRNIIKIMF